MFSDDTNMYNYQVFQSFIEIIQMVEGVITFAYIG